MPPPSSPDQDPARAIHARASRAVAWVGMASAVVAAVDAVALVILLKFWVTTAELGIATLAVTLFYFLDLVTEQGLGAVLIQQDKLDDDTASTIFWLNALIAAGAFLVLLVVAPMIGQFQGHAVVGTMLIVYGTKLFYQNVYFVPMAILRRELRFKELSIIRAIANFGDLAGRLGFAAAGEPIWCFVAGPLIRVFITGVGVQLCQPWRPRFVLRLAHARQWLTFASKTLGTWYLTHFYTNIGYQVVGHYFGEASLGVFRVAYELVLYPVNWISNVVQQVAFPTFARLRHDREALAAQFIRFSRQNLATILPILVVIMVGAPDILVTAFPSVHGGATAARVLCVVGTLRAFDSLYIPLLDGLGWAGRNLLVAVVASLVLVGLDVGMAAAFPDLDYLAVAIARAIGYPLVILLHAYLVLTTLELPIRRYLRALGGLVACAAVSTIPGVVVWYACPNMAVGPRLLIEVVTSLGLMVVLLARFEGISPRSVYRELSGR